MCVPIIGAAIGAAASIGGGLMKAQQQQAYVDALNKSRMESFNIARIARMREEKRQDKFTSKGFKRLNNTRRDVDAESQKAAMAEAEQKFVANNPTDQGFDALAAGNDPAAGNAATVGEKAKIIADAAAASRASVSNLSKLVSFGQVASGVKQRIDKNSDLLAILNNMRQGSLGVYEQERSIQAPEPPQPDTTMADMLTGLGGLFNRSPSSYG